MYKNKMMKKFISWLISMSLGLIGCLVLLWGFSFAESFVIDNYMVDMTIKDNGSLAITETIDVQFSESRHGIERLLPQRYRYDDTRDEIVDYSDITSNVTKSTYTEWSDLVLRLWDADRYVDGSQQYIISYTASPWVKQYSWWQELYWNLIGTQWWVPIRQVTFRVATPAGVDLTTFGTGEISVVRWSSWTSGLVIFNISSGEITGQVDNLSINEWVTIGVKFNDWSFWWLAPRQYLPRIINNQKINTEHQSTNRSVRLWSILWTGIWLFFAWLFFMPVRQENYKKQRAWTIITQYYPPPFITPAIAWYINNNAFDTVDFMATLYDWWARWYISIAEEIKSGIFNNKTHIIYYKKINPKDLVPYEQIIWNMMFDGASSFDFDNLDKGWFSNHGKIFFEWIINTITNESQKFYESAKGIAWWMWNKNLTTEWSKIYAHLLWYRDFIQTVEQNKLEEFIKQDPLFVDKLLPWAVIFGLETRLVQQLEWLERNKPERYIGDVFTINTFDYILNTSTKPLIPSSDSWVLKGLGTGFDIALGTISIVTGGWGWGGWGRSW